MMSWKKSPVGTTDLSPGRSPGLGSKKDNEASERKWGRLKGGFGILQFRYCAPVKLISGLK